MPTLITYSKLSYPNLCMVECGLMLKGFFSSGNNSGLVQLSLVPTDTRKMGRAVGNIGEI
jgi:hypothetical protein